MIHPARRPTRMKRTTRRIPAARRLDPVWRVVFWISIGAMAATGAAPAAFGSGPSGGSLPEDAATAPECSRPAALRIQSYYESVRDLRAHFEQETRRATLGSLGSAELVAGGEVVFAKPGRMRWSYETPEASLLVSDGDTVWVYDPAAAEAQKLPLGPAFLSGAAIQFLLGEGDLLEDFDVSALDCSARPLRLSLRPRGDAPYERLEVSANPETGEVFETVVIDLLGNRTRIALSDVRINTDPDPAEFRFVPPEGVRVLEALPTP